MSEQRIPVARDVFKMKYRDREPAEVVIASVRPPLVTYVEADGRRARMSVTSFLALTELVRPSPIADIPADERARVSAPTEPEDGA